MSDAASVAKSKKMKTRLLIIVVIVAFLFVFVPFEVFFMQDTTALTSQENRYHVLVKDEKISDIPAPYLEHYDTQTELIPLIITQHIQSNFPISSVNLRDVHFLNDIEYQSDSGGIANFPIPGNFDTGVKSVHGHQILPMFGSGACPLIGYALEVSCGPEDKRDITYGRCNIPIMRTFSDITSTQVKGVFPEQDGTYNLEFMSYYETDIELPENANLMNHKILTCDVVDNNEFFDEVYFHKMQFGLQE